MARSAAKKLCAYCGARPATTVDHVVPRCLFLRPLPQVMVTVPACKECNEAKAVDDDYLRDMLVIDIDNADHPVARQLLQSKVVRAARSNRSLMARDIRADSQVVPRYSMGGIYLGHCRATPLQVERVNRCFAQITRGLYYKLHRARIPDDYVFEIRRVDPLRKKMAVQGLLDAGVVESRRLGDNVFACMYGRGEDPFSTYWLQEYYSYMVSVSTSSPSEIAAREKTQPRELTSFLGD